MPDVIRLHVVHQIVDRAHRIADATGDAYERAAADLCAVAENLAATPAELDAAAKRVSRNGRYADDTDPAHDGELTARLWQAQHAIQHAKTGVCFPCHFVGLSECDAAHPHCENRARSYA